MNQSALRFTGGRKLDDNQLKKLRKIGGLGTKYDRSGRPIETVQILHDGKQNRIVIMVPNTPKSHKRHKMVTRELRDNREKQMEFEISGRHNRTKPTKAKRVKEWLKEWVDDGRPLAGVDL